MDNIVPGSTIITPGCPPLVTPEQLGRHFATKYPQMDFHFFDTADPVIDDQGDELEWLIFKNDLRILSHQCPELAPTWVYHYYFKRIFKFQKIFYHFIVEIRKCYPFDLIHCLMHVLESSQQNKSGLLGDEETVLNF